MPAKHAKNQLPQSDPNRNLTHERDLARLEAEKAQAVEAIPQYATVQAWVEKKDAKGKVVLDADGVPDLMEKRLLKRAVVAAKHDDRIAAYKRMRGIA